MGWLGNVSSRERWEAEPATTAAQAAACLVGFPFCLAYEVGAQSQSIAKRAREVSADVQARAEGLVTEAGDALATVVDSAARPLEQASNIAMWTAIGIIAATLAVFAIVALGFRIF